MLRLPENESGESMVKFRTDNGGEFCSNSLSGWLKLKGVKHKTTPPRTPQSNGVAERMNSVDAIETSTQLNS